MSEIKTEIKQNVDDSYTITDAHSTADIVRWLLTQDDKETIIYLLNETAPQRQWVGLTAEEEFELDAKYGYDFNVYIDQRDLKLKEKNT